MQRGLKEVAEGGDLQVATGILTTSIPQVEAVIFGGPANIYATPIATMGRYNREGTLVVNLIDTRTKKSAWIGMVTESIDNNREPDTRRSAQPRRRCSTSTPPRITDLTCAATSRSPGAESLHGRD